MTFRQLISLTTLTVSTVLGCTAIETDGAADTGNTRPATDMPTDSR